MHLQRSFNRGIALGVLRDDDGKVFFTTFEDKPIPAGTYGVSFCPHPKHGMAWEICNVPGRTGILFHIGNDAEDSEGCILVGLGFARDRVAITASITGYQRFLRFLHKLDTFTLTVADPK